MNIDLSPLYSGVVEEIKLKEEVTIDPAYYENMGILRMSKMTAEGKIYKNSLDDIFINCEVNGTLYLEDAISLEEISYPISLTIDENLQEIERNNENTLDIIDVLWENIVLEVPMKVTEVENFENFHGDGWKLISEDEVRIQDNPFRDLMKEEKE